MGIYVTELAPYQWISAHYQWAGSEIYQIVENIPSLDQPHHIIVRRDRNGKGGYAVSLECTVAADMPVSEAHQLSHLLERELSSQLSDVVEVFVHLEPPGSS